MSFDLSSTTSDDMSIVALSLLLPGCDSKEISTDEHKNDTSSKNINVNEREADCHKDNENDDNRAQSKSIRTTRTKESQKIETEKANNEGKRQCDGRTIRVIMGESVKAWRTQRNNNRTRNPTTRTLTKSKSSRNEGTNKTNIDGKNTDSDAIQSKYVVIQQRDTSSDPKMNQKGLSRQIDFKNSHLNVERSNNGSNVRIDIVETSSTSDNLECTNVRKQQTVYTTRKCKSQFSPHGNGPQSLSSKFVDCIALWDSKRQVYVLEVPQIIANDTAIMRSPDNGHDNATTEVNDRQLNSNLNGGHDVVVGSLARRRDPLEEQRQAEAKLSSHRKRRRS